jgi:hypothetical protein
VIGGEQGVVLVAVQADDLYWAVDAEGSTIIRTCKLPACSAPETIDTLTDAPAGLAVDDTYVLYAAGGTIASATRSAPHDKRPLRSGLPTIPSIARSGASLFYSYASSIDVCLTTTGVCGGGRGLSAQAGALAIDPQGASLFFVLASSEIWRAPAPSLELISRAVYAGAEIRALAARDGRLYWLIAGPSGALFATTSSAVDSTPSAALMDDLDEAWALAVDLSNVYVTTYRGGAVHAQPIAGGPARVVASGLAGPKGIALSADALYVAESRAGRILRIAK